MAFFRRFFKNPKQVGTLFPCSSFVADAMTRYLQRDAARVLEVGAGTGAITDSIINKTGSQSLIDLVEIDPEFCKHLRFKYRRHENLHVHECSILDWTPEYRYDAIILTIPLNTLTPDLVEKIFHKITRLAQPICVISYVELAGFVSLRKTWPYGKSYDHLCQVQEIKKLFYQKYGKELEFVWKNLPPARVMHFEYIQPDF